MIGYRTNMNIALILSGHLRSWERTFPVMRALIIDPLQISSVFISTYPMVGMSEHIDGNTRFIRTQTCLEKIKEMLNPIRIEVEPATKGIGAKYRHRVSDGRSADGVVSMFQRKWKADQLRQRYEKAGERMDIVIHTRPDVMFRDIIRMEDLQDAVRNQHLYLPSYGHFSGVNDQLAFGTPEVMKTYADCYNTLDQTTKKTVFHPEALLKQHLLDAGLKMSFFECDYVLARVLGEDFNPKEHSSGIPNDLQRRYE
jgi:hypothetical protein